MNTYEAIEARRSCRAFAKKPIAKEALERIVAAGLKAPSGKNAQTAEIFVIEDPEIREAFRKENAKIGGWKEDFDPFYGAPTILLVAAREDLSPMGIYDGSLVAENLMLATTEEGLGSIWIHRAEPCLQSPVGQKLLQKFGLEGKYVGVCFIAIGHAEKTLSARPIREGRVHIAD